MLWICKISNLCTDLQNLKYAKYENWKWYKVSKQVKKTKKAVNLHFDTRRILGVKSPHASSTTATARCFFRCCCRSGTFSANNMNLTMFWLFIPV